MVLRSKILAAKDQQTSGLEVLERLKSEKTALVKRRVRLNLPDYHVLTTLIGNSQQRTRQFPQRNYAHPVAYRAVTRTSKAEYNKHGCYSQ